MKLAVVLLAIVTAFVLAACGGGSTGTGDQGTRGSAPSISKAELIKMADAICRRTDAIQKERLTAYEKAHPKVLLGGQAGEKALRVAVFPPIAIEIKKVVSLGAPAGDRSRLRVITNGWSSALEKVEKKPSTVLVAEGPFARPDKLAAKYGFNDCATAL